MGSADNVKGKQKFNFGIFYSKFGILVILIAVFAISAVAVPSFASVRNITNILLAIACTTVLAFGATFVIILGHINIAYGSEIAFVGCVAVIVNVMTGQVWTSIIVALVIGLLLGLLTGFFVTKFSTPAFIMTLALTEACRGAAVIVTGGTTVQGMHENFAFLGQGFVGPIPMSIIIMAICFVVMWFILNRTVFGRHVYAVGGNANAAKASGIKPQRVVMKAFLLDGIMVGVGSLLLMGRLNAGVPSAGVSYEMDAITAVVVGGTSMSGGAGTLQGTLIGAVIVGIINNVQTLMGIDGNVQKIVKGIIIVAAVVVDVVTKNMVKKAR